MYFKIDQRNYGATGYHSGEAYGDWSETNNPSMESAKITEGNYWDVALFPGQPEPQRGGDIFLVWAEYSSGDSFGSSSGNVEFIWAFSKAEDAFALEKLLKEDNRKNPDYNFGDGNFVEFQGQKVSTSTWKGYFEHLEDIHVDRLEIK